MLLSKPKAIRLSCVLKYLYCIGDGESTGMQAFIVVEPFVKTVTIDIFMTGLINCGTYIMKSYVVPERVLSLVLVLSHMTNCLFASLLVLGHQG